MTDLIFEAPPRSSDSLELLAEGVRNVCGLEDEPYFPIVEFLELGLGKIADGVIFDVLPKEILGARMGSVDTLRKMLYLREDVYARAVRNVPRDRFTVAHEVGHALMHVGSLNMVDASCEVPKYRNPEWQANWFAGALLMPARFARRCYSVKEMEEKFGVSTSAARRRARCLMMSLPGM
jgi:hypothetical protein